MTARARSFDPAQTAWCALLAIPVFVPLAFTNLTALGFAEPFTHDMFRIAKLVTLGLFLAMAVVLWSIGMSRGGTELRWDRRFALAVAFLLGSLVSGVFSVSPRVSLFGNYSSQQGLITLAMYVILAFMAMQLVRSPSRVEALGLSVLLGGVLVGSYAVVQVVGWDPTAWGAGDAFMFSRGFSTIGNPNTLGGYLVWPLVIGLSLALGAESGARAMWYGLGTAVVTAAWLLTLSRGAWIAGFAGVALLVAPLVRARMRMRGRDWVVTGMVLLMLLSVGLAARSGIQGRIEEAWESGRSAGSGRIVLWETAMDAAVARPLLGWGPDAFRYGFYRYRPAEHAALGGFDTVADDAHNVVLNLAVTVGLPGLALGLALLVALLSGSARAALGRLEGLNSRIAFTGWYAALVGYIMYLNFGPASVAGNALLWLAAGILLAVGARAVADIRGWMKPTAAALTVVVTLAALGIWVTAYRADMQYRTALNASSGQGAYASSAKAVSLAPWVYEYRALMVEALGRMALAAGDGPEARRLADRADVAYGGLVRYAPHEYQAYVDYTTLLIELPILGSERLERIRDVAEQGIMVQPRGLLIRTQGAYALLNLGEYEDAVAMLEKDWDVAPGFIYSGLIYAEALLEAGSHEDAGEVLDVIERTYPGDSRVLALRSRLSDASPSD